VSVAEAVWFMLTCPRLYVVRDQEEFLTFRHMTNVDAGSPCEAILQTMTSLGLKCTVIAQCYDGASVLSGICYRIVDSVSGRSHECCVALSPLSRSWLKTSDY